MTEFVKAADGVRIAYDMVGEGEPVVLVHGFAASRVQNWKAPGWYDTLADAGYRVIAMDCRGHGDSDKPHDPAFYDHTLMAEDIVAVMGAAGAGDAFLMGYSMGGFLSMHVLMDHPDLLRKVVIGGVGGTYLGPRRRPRRELRMRCWSRTRARFPIPSRKAFANSPSKRARICTRSPPACAATAGRSAQANSRSRRGPCSSSAAGTTI